MKHGLLLINLGTPLPLYPQYSSAAGGSAIEETMRILSTWNIIPSVNIIRDFFQHPAYIKAQAALIKDCLEEETHVLFSYHGIPEWQITNSRCTSFVSDCLETLVEIGIMAGSWW